jgi:protein-tyrosine-phosphatase
MKKQITLAIVLLLTASLLFGCGVKSNDGAIAPEDAEGTYAGGVLSDSVEQSKSEPGEMGNTDASTPVSSQKLVRKVWLVAETEDLDGLLSQVQQRITELGGYVESREVYNGNSKNTYRSRNADLTIRIPAQQLNEFVAHVTENSNITSSNETADDITLSYVATQSRITALETEHARLLELLAKAETMEDLLKIESRLTDVRTELEEVTSQLRVYDNLVDYATVYLSINEVKEYTVVEEPETVWQRIGTGFMQSLKNLGTFFTELFVFLIVALPYLIPLGVVITVIILLATKRKKPKKDPPADKQ